MKLQILSDLHIEFGDFHPPETDADVIILAGDTHLGVQGVAWATEKFKGKEVIYVIGNHEYYHGTIPEVTEKFIAVTHEAYVEYMGEDLGKYFLATFLMSSSFTSLILETYDSPK